MVIPFQEHGLAMVPSHTLGQIGHHWDREETNHGQLHRVGQPPRRLRRYLRAGKDFWGKGFIASMDQPDLIADENHC